MQAGAPGENLHMHRKHMHACIDCTERLVDLNPGASSCGATVLPLAETFLILKILQLILQFERLIISLHSENELFQKHNIIHFDTFLNVCLTL